ncbi:MqnA/MqnD/SBP family protein [Nitratifractor sp.]
MIFGSIEYLNLLPFQVYMKRRIPSTQFQQMLRWRRAVPSEINRAFQRRRVHAAFISSVTSGRCRCTDLGIVADGEVTSVLLLPGAAKADRESASSNILAEILGLEGEVLIGDKALRHYLAGGEGIDLAREWKERTGLPFVFARLCHNHHGRRIEALAAGFRPRAVKIPRYLLERHARTKGIRPAELSDYLEKIGYVMGWREKRALRLFLKKVRERRLRQ